MRHIAEKCLFGFLALSGSLQRVFKKAAFPQLSLLFLFHLTETQYDFFRRQRLIKEDPHADPPIFFAEFSQKISAKIANAL